MRHTTFGLVLLAFAGLTLAALAACGPTVERGSADAGGGGPWIDAGPAVVDEPTGPDAGGGCTALLPLEPNLPPQLLIVLDRSGSMEERWADVTGAINQVVADVTTPQWGMSFFPTSSTAPGEQCNVDPVAVPVATGTAGAIAAVIAANGPYGVTPTQAAIGEAGAYLMTLTEPNPKYIILITDGNPNCAPAPNCTCPPGWADNGASQCQLVGGGPYDYYSCDIPGDLGINGTYWAIADLAAAGIGTFVFGLPTFGIPDLGLNLLAEAGGEPRAGTPRYYPATTPDELSSTLASLSASLVSCTFDLPDGFAPEELVGLTIDGVWVPHDPTRVNGWDFDGSGDAIRLYGSFCDTLQTGGAADVVATFTCPLDG